MYLLVRSNQQTTTAVAPAAPVRNISQPHRVQSLKGTESHNTQEERMAVVAAAGMARDQKWATYHGRGSRKPSITRTQDDSAVNETVRKK